MSLRALKQHRSPFFSADEIERREQRMEFMYRDGYRLAVISERFGCSGEVVTETMKRRGVPLRSRKKGW